MALLSVLLGCHRTTRSRDELTVLALSQPEHLDPRFPEDSLGANIGRLVYRSLLESDPRTFLPRPSLADSLTWVNPTHLRVTLRPGITFHHGLTLSADDVVATYQGILDPALGSRLRTTYSRVFQSVSRIDDRTVEFVLHRPDGTVESLLQQPILPAHDARGSELVAAPGRERRFDGAGPLRVLSLGEGQWSLTRREPVADAPSTFRFLSLHDPNTLALRLLHDDADIAEIKPELFSVFENNPHFSVVSAPSVGFTYLGLQCEQPALRDPRVRAAIAHAIDRERLREGRFGRHAVASTGPLAPQHWAYEPAVERRAYDPARARAMLDAAGLRDPSGEAPRMHLVLRVSSQRFAVTVANAVAAMLREVGIDVDVRASELATLIADLRAGRFDLALMTVPDLSDPWGLAFWFHSRSIPSPGNLSAGGNRWRFRSAALDAALDAGGAALGPDARRPHYQLAQRILASELPVIPMWHADVVYAVSNRYTQVVPRGDSYLDFLLNLRRR